MSQKDLYKYVSSILSIVLSHHYQKEDILTMLKDTPVDFSKVRDTMYKYSKKVEEKFFTEPCFAYFFVQFSTSHWGKQYIQNKMSKVEEVTEGDKKFKNSREMNERLVSEIELMTYEAKQFLVRHYLENIDDSLTFTLLKNIGVDADRLVSAKAEKAKNSKSMRSLIQNVLQEVRYEHIDLSTSAENESKMEASSDSHQDIQISRFNLSDAS